jgi:hypothetical protein
MIIFEIFCLTSSEIRSITREKILRDPRYSRLLLLIIVALATDGRYAIGIIRGWTGFELFTGPKMVSTSIACSLVTGVISL